MEGMEQALEKILKVSSPEALQAFHEWMTYNYIRLGVKIFLVLLIFGVGIWAAWKMFKSWHARSDFL